MSPSLADLRARCLAQAHAALRAVGELAGQISVDELPGLGQAVATLPSVARCGDPQALLADATTPPPAIAAAVAALDDRLAEVRVHVEAAGAEAPARAAAALAAARDLGYLPTLGTALILAGRAQRRNGDLGAARFAEAVGVSLDARADGVAVEAFARHLWAAGMSAGVAPDGLDVIKHLAARLPAGGYARALLSNNLGVVALANGDRAGARAAFSGALAELATVDGPEVNELLGLYSNLALVADDDRERTRLLDELIRIRTAELGPAHPLTLDVRITRGMFATDLTEAATLLAGACGDLARYHERNGSDLADCWFELALVAEATGQPGLARDALERVVATAATGGDPSRITQAQGNLDRLAGRGPAALAAFDAVRATLAADQDRWWAAVQRAEALVGHARTLLAMDRRREAGREATQAAEALAVIEARQRLPWIARRVALALALAAEATSPRGSR